MATGGNLRPRIWLIGRRRGELERMVIVSGDTNMLHVALWEPEIPPNTGNIARLCVATGATLHLIGRIGFRLDDRSLRRAGVDYWDEVDLRRHATLADFEAAMGGQRVFCLSAH